MNIKDILKGQLGFGTAPLGNMYRNISEEEASATVEAAWDSGFATLTQPLSMEQA